MRWCQQTAWDGQPQGFCRLPWGGGCAAGLLIPEASSPLGLALSNLRTGLPASVPPDPLPTFLLFIIPISAQALLSELHLVNVAHRSPWGHWQGDRASVEPCSSEVEALRVLPQQQASTTQLCLQQKQFGIDVRKNWQGLKFLGLLGSYGLRIPFR